MLIYNQINQRADPHHKQVAEASCGAGTFQIQSGSYRACARLLGFHHVMVGWFWALESLDVARAEEMSWSLRLWDQE